MTDSKSTDQTAPDVVPSTESEISDKELDKIVGGAEEAKFDVEQVLNIGSQSSGAGAGKVTFNPFSITRHVDKASPVLFL
jgi:bacteriocin-like protein